MPASHLAGTKTGRTKGNRELAPEKGKKTKCHGPQNHFSAKVRLLGMTGGHKTDELLFQVVANSPGCFLFGNFVNGEREEEGRRESG